MRIEVTLTENNIAPNDGFRYDEKQLFADYCNRAEIAISTCYPEAEVVIFSNRNGFVKIDVSYDTGETPLPWVEDWVKHELDAVWDSADWDKFLLEDLC